MTLRHAACAARFILCAAALSGCATVNLGLQSVPEEGGIRFTQVTSTDDNVVAPKIFQSREFGVRYGVMKPFDLAPNGRTIAFLGAKNEQVNVFLKDTRGGVATTQRTFRDAVFDVSFSGDGQRIAFADLRNQRWNVYEVSASQGSAIKQITNFEQVSRYPVYAPNANKLMFVQAEPSMVAAPAARGLGGILVGPAGKELVTGETRFYVWETDMEKNAYTQHSEGYAPAYSPDGKRLAITRNSRDHSNAEIWLVDLGAGTETLVASSKGQGYSQPSFSPDGRRLVFTGVTHREKSRPANLDIFVVDVDGSNLTQLTFHPAHDLAARFSPDGNAIYFLSQRGNAKGSWNIWRMDAAR